MKHLRLALGVSVDEASLPKAQECCFVQSVAIEAGKASVLHQTPANVRPSPHAAHLPTPTTPRSPVVFSAAYIDCSRLFPTQLVGLLPSPQHTPSFGCFLLDSLSTTHWLVASTPGVHRERDGAHGGARCQRAWRGGHPHRPVHYRASLPAQATSPPLSPVRCDPIAECLPATRLQPREGAARGVLEVRLERQSQVLHGRLQPFRNRLIPRRSSYTAVALS